MRVYLFGGVTLLEVSVFETLTGTESVKAVCNLGTRRAESLTVAENVRASLTPLTVTVFDAVTCAESRTLLCAPGSSRGDTVSVNEFVKVVLPQLAVHASDSVTVAEARTVLLAVVGLSVNKFDAVTVVESRTAFIPFIQTAVDQGRAVRFEVTHPTLGSWGITLPAYKWGYTRGSEWLHRAMNTTAYGSHRRIPLNITRGLMTVRFVEADEILDEMRKFTFFVHRFARDVRFYPDYLNAPGTYWTLDWPTDVTFSRVLDNRQELEISIVEHSPGGAGA